MNRKSKLCNLLLNTNFIFLAFVLIQILLTVVLQVDFNITVSQILLLTNI